MLEPLFNKFAGLTPISKNIYQWLLLYCTPTTCLSILLYIQHLQKQPPEAFCKKRCSLKFWKACNFLKKETLAQVFSCEFCKTPKNMFSTEQSAEHFQMTASAPSSSISLLLLLISLMFVFYSNSKGFKEFECSMSFSLSHFHHFFFFFHDFLSFSVLLCFFLPLLIKRILLKWELIKMLKGCINNNIKMPLLTSLKYVHVSK